MNEPWRRFVQRLNSLAKICILEFERDEQIKNPIFLLSKIPPNLCHG